MATLFGGGQQQEQDKDKEQKGQQQQQTGITPIGLAGSGGGTTGAAPGASVPMTGQQQKPASSGFTNVRQFVEANRGAGSKIADKSTSNIAQNVRQASGQVGQVSDLGSDVRQEEQRIGRADQVKQAIQSNPLTLTQDENEFSQARQLITGQTAAEQQRQMLQERAGAAAQALQGAQQQVQGLGTESGRFGLLRKAVGGPSYSQGQQRLDQLLFQTEGAKQIGQAQRQFGSELARQVQTKEQLEQDLGSRIGQYQALAGQKAQELTGELGTQKGNIVKSTEQERQQLSENRAKQNTAIEKFFTQGLGSLSDAEKEFVNTELGENLGIRTYGLLKDRGFENFRSVGKTDLSREDVIDQATFARYKALADLAALQDTERAFTRVGDRGPESDIKVEDLLSASGERQREIANQLNRQASRTAQGPWFSNPEVSQANLLNLLNVIENPGAMTRDPVTGAQRVIPIETYNTRWGLDSNPTMNDTFVGARAITDARASNANVVNDPLFNAVLGTRNDGTSGIAAANLIRDLLSEIRREGYEETLGGQTTKNTRGLTSAGIANLLKK